MNIDVQTLSLPELNRLIAAAEARKALVSSRRPAAAVRRQIIAAARAEGYTVAELFDADVVAAPAAPAAKRRPTRRRTGKVAPKYRDPENKRNTWSGRGRMPRWLAEKTRHGRSPTDFLIPGLARPTLRKGSPIGQKTVFKKR